MRQRIKDDVESMAAQARRLVTDEEGVAQHSTRDFAWRLVLLGRVYDAVPGFRELVRMQINILLDRFLDMIFKQGHDLVRFKLGMILEQCEWFQDDERQDRTESDFQCFRDVLTFVWNKQTVATQKNASSIVKGIDGESLTFGPQGEVQHVTEVVNGSTLLVGCQVFERSSTGILLRGTLADSRWGTSRKRL